MALPVERKFDVSDMTVSSKGCKKHVLFSCHAIVSVIFMAVVSIIQVSLWPFCLLFKISVYGHHAHRASLIMEGLRSLQNRFSSGYLNRRMIKKYGNDACTSTWKCFSSSELFQDGLLVERKRFCF